ncbi:MAG: hypothetical protein RLZZ546_2591, partial [Bacteroidota bacterium]
MQITKLGYQKLGLNSRDLKYKSDPNFFDQFLSFYPTLDGLKEAVLSRKDFPVNRQLIFDAISSQYHSIDASATVQNNIQALKNNSTYTITTAHQPSLFTGPLYFIYKAFSCINLAKRMKEEMPEINFVPIFVLGSEDHDFDEVNHFTIFGKKITWDNNLGGPVGRYNLTDLDKVLEQAKEILGADSKASHILLKIEEFLDKSNSYNQFNIMFLNYLFGNYGLVVVNMDNFAFKKAFIPILEKEIFEEVSFNLVKQTQDKLSSLGFEPQAHAREINVFYLGAHSRERIVKNGDVYEILNTNLIFTAEELRNELHTNPQNFSPNVILRPIYQEYTLPNIAYVGGGGELAYWMERKTQFQYFNVFY